MACFDNMKVSSENREAHWCTSSGWVKSHAPPHDSGFGSNETKRTSFDVLYMSCTSQLCWIDVPACLWDEVSKFANTDQNLDTNFWVSKMDRKGGTHMGTYSECPAALSLLSVVLAPQGGIKFRAPIHAAAKQMTIHYVNKKIKPSACLRRCWADWCTLSESRSSSKHNFQELCAPRAANICSHVYSLS